ncbi:hypothetical protein RclHR1_04780002 [Rhizophagus clarus]|uniref:Uncharacterized protein n=1 Tax=Rhizophagus clarus TaxID=94130 RepID=A0A2Z6RWH0_9GLOM|nr:hypothetical protein RclHR1_04780002 [Rhizophagus clarus]
MYTNIAKFLDVSPEWVENWLNTPIKETGHNVNATFKRTDIFQIHEIARVIMYQLNQLAEEDYWKAVMDYKNSDEELEHAFKKYVAFAYQVEIEKIMLQGGFAYKDTEKIYIIYHINMLANGLDPYEIPGFGEPEEESSWQPDYWGDEDPDNPANWQLMPNESDESDEDLSDDSSDSDEDPDYPY